MHVFCQIDCHFYNYNLLQTPWSNSTTKNIINSRMSQIQHFSFEFLMCIITEGTFESFWLIFVNQMVYLCLYPLSRQRPAAVPITSHLESQMDNFFPTSGRLMTRLEAVSGLMKWRVTGLTYLYNHINYVHLSGGPGCCYRDWTENHPDVPLRLAPSAPRDLPRRDLCGPLFSRGWPG